MSTKSNNQGRAFEYACICALKETISKIRPVSIIKNSSLIAAKRAWDTIPTHNQNLYKISAISATASILKSEPRIIESNNDVLELSIQTDKQGTLGDVRDILIIRKSLTWEIGLSVKHNHFAVKHSRLSNKLDFGASWYNIPCSEQYWKDVNPVFEYLNKEKQKGSFFKDLPNKEDDVYIPLLNAFMSEISRQYTQDKNLPRKMVEYLLGKFDFYKLVSIDKKQLTQIQAFNLHGTLNQSGTRQKPEIIIPSVLLPTRIVKMDFVPERNNTIEMYMDAGWQFTFRIHNAEKKVVPSLKFDIQIVGMPTTLLTINCIWEQ
ncbi:MAG: HaeIII family restriction endonuclease [Bacteroidaceae bacterium]|nr:HaeIII family restriction endonuclease [Bacteroidaceae bacterium]